MIADTAGRAGSGLPWYREPWPWILMAGPVAAVIGGAITAYIAVTHQDGLVAEDYYKRGLAAGTTIARSERAQSLGVVGAVRLMPDRIVVRMSAKSREFAPPAFVALTLSHPTRAGLDQSADLKRDGDAYSAPFRLPTAGHWLVMLEDDAKSWRLMGNVVLPASGDVVIGAEQPADIRNQ